MCDGGVRAQLMFEMFFTSSTAAECLQGAYACQEVGGTREGELPPSVRHSGDARSSEDGILTR